jgi:beta-lactam-binding protein with PASTA domain
VQTVLTQSPAANSVLHPGATVTLTMDRCPQ